MTQLNDSQVKLLGEMVEDSPYMVVVRPVPEDPADKNARYDALNKEVDELIASGFVADVTLNIPKPQGFNREFRVIAVTQLGASLFGEGPMEVGKA